MDPEKKKSIINQQNKASRERRSNRRQLQTLDFDGNVLRISLQNCSTLEENRDKLTGLLYQADGSKFNFRCLLGLISVLDHLQCMTIIPFQDAFDIYASFFEHEPDTHVFRDKLLDHNYGLICCYFSNPFDKITYITLRTTIIPVEKILGQIFQWVADEHSPEDSHLQPDTVEKIINSMDTEYDKQSTKALLMSIPSITNKVAYLYGMNPQTAKKHIERVSNIADECENAVKAAEDIVNLRLGEKIQNLQSQLETVQRKIDNYKTLNIENPHFLGDLEEEKKDIQSNINEQKELKLQKDPYHTQRFQQAVKRTAQSLVDDNRVKKRKLGAGPNDKIDEEDEEFLLNCIESKATAHGRRHDSVLYLSHAVRKKDFKRLINHHRTSTGKAPIKSSTTVYNRAKPKNIRSLQAKRHRGKWLFACKKPTKSEERNKVHTKHQRAHVKRAVIHLCKSDKSLSLIHSMDDKAYLKPEASDGLDKFRVFQTVDVSKQRQLPKYDFAQAKLNITPSSHRFFSKEITSVDSKVEMVMDEDENVCVFRPKFYTGSSGSVWASEDRRIRHEKPNLYEIPDNDVELSNEFHGVAAILKDKANHYLLQSMPSDYAKVTNNKDCPYRAFEELKVKSLSFNIEKAKTLMDNVYQNGKTQYENECLVKLYDATKSAISRINNVQEKLRSPKEEDDFELLIEDVGVCCTTLIETVKGFKLRRSKSRVLELTDGGPGVGKSNRDVRFRAAEKVLLDNLDFYTRIHRASGDCQNEVERTQAAVGKAISDGGSIPWEYKTLDISDDNVKNMSIEDIEKLEDEINKFNVTQTCKDLSRRVESAPGPRGGFMSGLVSYDKDELFFNDDANLKQFLDTAPSKRSALPGFNYYQKVSNFYDNHFSEGELYMEFVRFNCAELSTNDELCEFCESGWSGKPVTCVPRPFPTDNHEYLKYDDTPLATDGEKRKPDDFQPRCQLRALFEEGKIKSDMTNEIETFGKKYAVEDTSLIKNELSHLEMIKFKREKRAMKRKQKTESEKSKKVMDFDWSDLHSKGKIKDLSVNLLTMFIVEKKLCHPVPRIKTDKIALVEGYLSRQKAITQYKKSNNKPVRTDTVDNSDTDDDVISDSSDDEIVLQEINSESETEDIQPPAVHVNRFGRSTSHWKQRKFYGDSDSESD